MPGSPDAPAAADHGRIVIREPPVSKLTTLGPSPLRRQPVARPDGLPQGCRGILFLPALPYHGSLDWAHGVSPRFIARTVGGSCMSGMERVFQIDQMLSGRKSVTRRELQDRLGVSWAPLKRDLAYLKDRLNAPIVFDRDLGGYRFDRESKRVGPQYELPGLWFSAEENHALLTMQHLLSNLDTGGLLDPQIKPPLARLTGLLGAADDPVEQVQRRIRVQTVGARKFNLDDRPRE